MRPSRGALSVWSVARDSWVVFRHNRRSLLLIAVVLEVPLVLVEIVLHATSAPSFSGNRSTDTLIALTTVYGSLSHHFMAGLLEIEVASERHGGRAPAVRGIGRTLRWDRLVIADVLLTLVTAVGLALAIVPGLLAMAWFALVLPLINVERLTVLAAFRRSVTLVRGSAWRVGLIALVSFVVPELVVAGVVVVAHTGNVIIDALVTAVPAVILLPLAALPIVLTTYEMIDIETAQGRDVATS